MTVAAFDHAVTEWIYWFLQEKAAPSLLIFLAAVLVTVSAPLRRRLADRRSREDIDVVLAASRQFTNNLRANIWDETCPYGSGPYCLYAWYQVDGKLLYVGQSRALQGRVDQHLKTAPWALRVGYMAVLGRFVTEKDVLVAEKKAIQDMRPLYNVIHAEWVA